MSSFIKPLHDRVVIERLEAEEKTASGIVLPGSATEKPDTGIVVAVGEGKVLENGSKIAMNVKIKDKVIFGKYSGQTVKLDGKEYLIMREEDIFGIIA
jgi:chaperonin GroES